ncbi:major facilitator superfamily protein [Hirsutella rhossiliensis]|uniref:Major facilitator superfamily domain-containing protein n=1 Tax=Hirsutella rhossiliensis TaxID=111463 RepID=A0A9P8N5W2_9HYPO|nr:major facilitator superfamily domain-containing protein [Hirsutella rhossiliensis]KAH0967532.1 major facilitator superfamily domain-containing protein [Hirsutella rhossiliensis]
MPWRVAPGNASVPAIPAIDGASDLAPASDEVEHKPDPDSLASSNSDNDTPRTDKDPWAQASQPLPSSSPATDPDRELDRIGIPNGGLRAWLVVVGAFIDFMVALGLLNSFGIFQARYEAKWPDRSTATLTWIGSTQLFVLFAGGLFVGPAFDKYGSRTLMLLGTGCCLASFLCTSWSTNYWHFLLSQGFLFGLGNALLFYPVTGAVSEWFDKSRGLALGIAAAGSSVGGVFWPIILSSLFDTMLEETVHRIVAVISTPLLLLSCLLVKERKEAAGHDTSGNQVQPSQSSASKAIFEWRFLALSVCLMILYCGVLIPFYYVPLYALDHGVNRSMANNLLAVTYAGSFFGRIGAGWLADRLGRFNILFLMGTLMSVVTFCWIWMTSLGAMIAFSVLFGLFSGGLVPLGPACVAQTTHDMGHIGLRIGVMMVFSSAGALSGGPLSGILRDGPTGWLAVHSFSAGVALAGALLLLGVRIWHRPYALAKF